MRTALVPRFACLLLSGLLVFTGVLQAQDLAPASLAGQIYTVFQSSPRDSSELPAHSGVLGIDGKRYPINTSEFRTFSGASDFTWVKSSSTSGALTVLLGPRLARLEITFTNATHGTYRQQTDGIAQIATGEIFFSPIPADPLPPLVNVSTRTLLTATQPAIAGFVVEGARNRTVLVRVIGPTLSRFGVANPVATPVLTVFKAAATIAENASWGGTAALAAAFARVGAFELPADSRDCAVLLSLEPGNYSARAASSAPGEVLLELYYVD